MSGPPYLSRLILRREDPRVSTLAPALFALQRPGGRVPDAGLQMMMGHHLIWSLFAGKGREDARRDFLWREEEDGVYAVLSRRKPASDHFLLALDQCKPFQPVLSPGDKLHFVLRANPVTPGILGRDDSGNLLYRKKRSVTAPRDQEERSGAGNSRALRWLERHGAQNGFSPCPGTVEAGAAIPTQIHRSKGGEPIRFVIVNFAGIVRVEDSDRFVRSLALGLGPMKSFGCGLMLVRRARL